MNPKVVASKELDFKIPLAPFVKGGTVNLLTVNLLRYYNP
jgi:hypothetical protein